MTEKAKLYIELEARKNLTIPHGIARLSEQPARLSEPWGNNSHIPHDKSIASDLHKERIVDGVISNALLSTIHIHGSKAVELKEHQFNFYNPEDETEPEITKTADETRLKLADSLQINLGSLKGKTTQKYKRSMHKDVNLKENNFKSFGENEEKSGDEMKEIKERQNIHKKRSVFDRHQTSVEMRIKLESKDSGEDFENEYQKFKNEAKELFESNSKKRNQNSQNGETTPKISSFQSKSNINSLFKSKADSKPLFNNHLVKQNKQYQSGPLNVFPFDRSEYQKESISSNQFAYSSKAIGKTPEGKHLNSPSHNGNLPEEDVRNILISVTPCNEINKDNSAQFGQIQSRIQPSSDNGFFTSSVADFKKTLFANSNMMAQSYRKNQKPERVDFESRFAEKGPLTLNTRKKGFPMFYRNHENIVPSHAATSYRTNFEYRDTGSPIANIKNLNSNFSLSSQRFENKILERYTSQNRQTAQTDHLPVAPKDQYISANNLKTFSNSNSPNENVISFNKNTEPTRKRVISNEYNEYSREVKQKSHDARRLQEIPLSDNHTQPMGNRPLKPLIPLSTLINSNGGNMRHENLDTKADAKSNDRFKDLFDKYRNTKDSKPTENKPVPMANYFTHRELIRAQKP